MVEKKTKKVLESLKFSYENNSIWFFKFFFVFKYVAIFGLVPNYACKLPSFRVWSKKIGIKSRVVILLEIFLRIPKLCLFFFSAWTVDDLHSYLGERNAFTVGQTRVSYIGYQFTQTSTFSTRTWTFSLFLLTPFLRHAKLFS